MSRAGQALMYAAGGVFAAVAFITLAAFGYSMYSGDQTWLWSVLLFLAMYWWFYPILAIMGFIGWFIARGMDRRAALTMIIGGGAFTFTIFYLLALVNFWEPLLVAAALLYVPSIITLALGIHAYVTAPPVTGPVAGGRRGRTELAIYQSLRPRRILRSDSGLSHNVGWEERRRRALR